jgi:cytochrome c553
LIRNKALITILLSTAAWAETPMAKAPDAAGAEFFESKIRPVLSKNCYGCHAGDTGTPMGGLYLNSRKGMLSGGKSGPAIVPGKPDDSLLLHAIKYEGRKMPPSGQLSDAVIADFEKWIAMGAPDPRVDKVSTVKPSAINIDKGREYWAFQPPQKPVVPKVKNAKWSSEAIDRFLLARMEKERVTPVLDADRATWLRRVTFDLTGLPPTPEEIDAFAQDRTKGAYAKVVDRLLASDRFGERWGRHWLDVARYADSVGRGRNYPFPFAWRYRNWVIEAFNQDLPYDQFVREQIAGDLLPSETIDQHNRQLIATGFLTLGSLDLVEQNPTVFRMDAIDEQINATSRAFMGVTVGCARCHDHKFDPIPTSDYYAMAGIFKSTEMLSGLQRRPRDNASYFNMTLLAKLNYAPGEKQPEFLPDPKEHQKWEELQQQITELQQNPRKVLAKLNAQEPAMKGKAANLNQNQAAGQKLRIQAQQILNQMDQFPLPKDLVMAVREVPNPTDSEILNHGEVTDVGPSVPRGFPQVMMKPGEKAQIGAKESGRLELAQWLSNRNNPMTARVAVNRIWEHLFGVGIVATVDNFGAMGEKPTNQALLDYLAVRFMDQGWSTKKMIREIVLSRAYRLSSAASDRNEQIDPGNVLLWRANRRRLEMEAIRDSLLMIAGRLDLNRPVESPVMDFRRGRVIAGKKNTARNAPEDYAVGLLCRTVYVPVVRNFLPDMFETFDFPEPSETKGVREVTTVPTQALFMMNSKFAIDQSKHAADNLAKNNSLTPQARVTRAYREVLGRTPTAPELQKSLEFVKDTDPLVWEHLYQALFASAEFRYRS